MLVTQTTESTGLTMNTGYFFPKCFSSCIINDVRIVLHRVILRMKFWHVHFYTKLKLYMFKICLYFFK